MSKNPLPWRALLPCLFLLFWSAADAAGPVYSSPATISLFAGIPGGSTDGAANHARFSHPTATAVDSVGAVFVVDSDNATIRKIAPDGTVSTFAGRAGERDLVDGTGASARFNVLRSLTIDSADNLYVLDFGQIRKITPAGVVSTLPGVPLARFSGTSSLTVDAQGVIYIADQQTHTIHRYAGGTVSLVAGSSIGYANGPGSNAKFNGPADIAVDIAGNLYIADQQNNVIRKITPDGVVSTLAGSQTLGQDDGLGSAASFWYPQGVAADGAGIVYVADWGNSTIRKISPDGKVSTVAGRSALQGSTDGSGKVALFNQPVSLSVSRAGDLYVADTANNSVRKITPAGQVTTYAGSSSTGSNDGGALQARFQYPSAVAIDRAGNLYVADRLNNTIRKIVGAKNVTTVAGMADSGSGYVAGRGIDARFWWPSGLAVDDGGNVFVTDSMNNVIRKIAADGAVTIVAGIPYPRPPGTIPVEGANPGGSTDGAAAEAQFYSPFGIALDGSGNLYVTDQWNHTVRKITPAGQVSTLAGQAGSSGIQDGQGAAARFDMPTGIACDAQGTLYVTDQMNHTIRRITPTGTVTTFAGSAGSRGSDDGSATAARFNNPTGVAVDASGTVYVADYGNNTIRMITSGGTVSTLAGYPGRNGYGHGETNSYGFQDGSGQAVRFDYPHGIAVSSNGTLYIADMENNAIRMGSLTGPPVITTQPQSQTVTAGGAVQFSVTATGVPAPTYQWYFNGAPFNGATSSSLSFSNARASDAGDYTVIATNTAGNVTSNKVTLTVTTATAPPPSGAGGNGGGSGGGGGGGAPSPAFLLALAALTGMRLLSHRR